MEITDPKVQSFFGEADFVNNSKLEVPIKVLQLTTVPMTAISFLLSLAKRLKNLGYEVTFACSSGECFDKLKVSGFEIKEISLRRKPISFSNVVALWELFKFIKKKKFHIVHVHTPIAGVLGRIAAKLAGCPIIIYTLHGSFFDENIHWWKRFVFLQTERFLGKVNSFMFTVNKEDADDFVERRIIPKEKVESLGCGGSGVNLKVFNPERVGETTKKALKKEFGIDDEEQVVGFVGRPVKEKGIFELIEAFCLVLEKKENVKLLMIGGLLDSERDQKSLNKLKMKIENNIINNRVILTGMRQDIPELISIMDVVVLPSHREGFGMTIAEASAMGKSVVATNIRGCREAVANGETGTLVPVKDVKALAEAIIYLLQNKEIAQEMGQAGRKRAEEFFDERKIFQRVEAKYKQLLTEKIDYLR